MPKRPREHELETESRRAFEDALAPRLIYRRQEPDYGIDGEVEEFDQDRHATGVRFYAQLKGTDEADLRKALRVSISVEHVNYYRSLALPVLMVRYHAPTARVFVRWVHAYTGSEPRPEQRSLTFRWSEEDAWRDDQPRRLGRDARAFVELHQASLHLPVPFGVEIEANVFGLTRPEVEIALSRAVRHCPGIVRLEPGDESTGRLVVTSDRSGAYLAGVSGASVALTDAYDPGPDGDGLSADLMVLAGLAFWRVGQAEVASRLGTAFLGRAQATLVPEFVWALISATARARRVTDAVKVCDELDARGDPVSRHAALLFSLVAVRHSKALSPEEAAAYEGTMRRCIERRLADRDEVEAAQLHYNLARHFNDRAEPHEAIEQYETAARFDPRYRNRGYYWRELAGMLFVTRRYGEAASAYRRAVELGVRGKTSALLADAELFAGNYEEARSLFEQYLRSRDPSEPGDEFTLKALLAGEIIDRFGLRQQDRDRDSAGELTGRLAAGKKSEPDAAAAVCDEALALDALSPLPWFNLGRADLDRGRGREAGFDYLAAALLREDDPEAWVNAFALLWHNGEFALMPAIYLTADRFTQGGFMTRLAQFAREQGSDFPRADFLGAVQELANLLPREEPSEDIAVRLIDEDGRVTTVNLGSFG